jgi:hypothetical protein
VLDANRDYKLIQSAARFWLSRPGMFRASSVQNGNAAELIAYDLLEPLAYQPHRMMITYQLSKAGQLWIREYREKNMAIYHKNPTVYEMEATSALKGHAHRENFYSPLSGVKPEVHLFIHDDGGAWVLAYVQLETTAETRYRIYEWRTADPIEGGDIPAVVNVAMARYLEAHDLAPAVEVTE